MNSPNWSVDKALSLPQRQRSRPLTHNGKTQNLKAWAREIGISHTTLRDRINRWGLETALSLPKVQRVEDSVLVHYRPIAYKGKTQSIYAWTRELGLDYDIVRSRLRHWSPQKVFNSIYAPPLAQTSVIPNSSLPAGVKRGYYVRDVGEELGEVYQLRINRWTHSGAINLSHLQYSRTWRTRLQAIADLAKSTCVEVAA